VTVLQGIGAEKRARQLEGMFLHDLHNTVQGHYGWFELLLEAGGYAPRRRTYPPISREPKR